MNIETKVKVWKDSIITLDCELTTTTKQNVRFLAELVKFKICSTSQIFNFLKMCLDDFAHHNIDVACNLLETCGRFLYRTPETHIRLQNMVFLFYSYAFYVYLFILIAFYYTEINL